MRQKLQRLINVIWLVAMVQIATLPMPANADDDCKDPVAEWQSRQTLKNRLEQLGWQIQRIRIDDGCYQVHAIDELGRRVKATFTPASLSLIKLEIRAEKTRIDQGEKARLDQGSKTRIDQSSSLAKVIPLVAKG